MFDVYNGVRERFRRIPCEQSDFVDIYLGDDDHTRDQRQKLQQTCDRLRKVLENLGGRKMADLPKVHVIPIENELDKLEKKLKIK